ncbi:MAG: hypothetical protein F4117_12450 [Acidimicrobiales bacterium]|nr:hypothetical protein [Acidimicrobiales bacterium]MYB82719.1 hypothetical protein [Acidimicrobiales bacterium]MYI13356.1 hypothetical protein [Acidimicrobiales bacterium]
MFHRAPRGSDDSQIDDVLAEMRREAHDSADLASRFERLCQGVLGALSDGDGRRVFDRVDRWDDWAGRDGPGDGIGLVAHSNSARDDDADAVAIQCRCSSGSRLVSKQDVASFLANSDSARFRARMLIHTAKGLSADLQRQIDDRQKPCHVIDLAEMRRWKLDWWVVAEAVGAVAPPHPSPGRATAAGQPGDTDPRSPVGPLLSKTSRALLSRGVAVGAIAVGTLMVFSGADIGVLLVLGGIFVLARRRGIRSETGPRPVNRPPGGRRGRATSQRDPDSDDWSDDDQDWENGGDRDDVWEHADEWDRVERREDEWEREDRRFWAYSERDSAEHSRRDRADEWVHDDEWGDADSEWDRDDGWDWDDDEPPRRSASRGRGRGSSWEADDGDYI